ncbi:MAG: hypothetical protein QUS14_11305 [Pyrinomonadaceae bacterium]|nr:hypothetical protein [Pyrinomonadaceae bacterium]
MDTRTIIETIALYERHGWQLRRALLNAEPSAELAAALGDIPTEASQQNALWFSRRSREDSEAWELRRLEGSPFALVTVIPDDADDDEREAMLAETEEEMLEANPRETGH